MTDHDHSNLYRFLRKPKAIVEKSIKFGMEERRKQREEILLKIEKRENSRQSPGKDSNSPK
ncbi:hypothetical protein DFP98_11318 [Cohnella phaseoli]|uniref:Uncharacterized protein n=1 Tax=Cohnella phaseoli TaxID=456490 RepID=A0A3D9JPM5_9BACL|nr:hypothetical protein DFP98_11318 [Cohnella phaseoli]